jgi:Holliday junction resolvase RusA-like endonuclease
MSGLTLRLPYPPSVNAMYGSHGNRRFIRPRGRLFKEDVAKICKGLPTFGDAFIELHIVLFPRDKRLMDISNSIKGIEDALQDAGIFTNDQQVCKITIERGQKIKGGGCEVTVTKYFHAA